MGTKKRIGLVALAGALMCTVWWTQRGGGAGAAVERPGAVERQDERAALEPPVSPRAVATEPIAREVAVTTMVAGLDVLVVTDATRAPIADALVLALNGAGEFERARTGADGRATLSAGFKATRVAACAAGHAAAALDVTIGAPMELELRREGVLRGVVLVDGATPREPLALKLWTTAGVGDLELLEPFADALRDERGFHGEGSLPTDAQGRFEQRGLDPDWSGRMRVPYVLKIRSTRPELPLQDHEFVDLRALVPELVIEATELPILRGRVIDAATRAPMPHATLSAFVEFEGDNVHSPMTGCQADQEGRFAVGLEPSSSRYRESWIDPAQRASIARIELRVHSAGDNPAARFEFEASELANPLDVGDLAVAPSAALFLRIVDAAGAPVASARVAGEGKASEATDTEGRTRIPGLPAGPLELTAAAFGHRPLVIELGAERGSEQEPVELSLAAGNVVEFVPVGPDGARPEGLTVGLELPPDAFAGVDARRLGHTAFEQLAGPFGARSWNDERLSMELRPHPDGSLALSGLRAGIEGTARAVDGIGQVAGEQRFVSPPEGERLEVRIEVAAPEVELHGRVVDETGAPLPGVQVMLKHARRGHGARTDTDGHFSYGPLVSGSAEAASLTAELPGRVTRVLEDIRITRDMPLLEIVLGAGLAFEVELAEEGGRPAPAARLHAQAKGYELGRARALGDGRFELEQVPPVELELILWIGGREHRFRAHATEKRARFTVPDHGALTVELGDPEELRARITLPGEPEFEHTVRVTDPIALQPGSYLVEPVRWELRDGTRGYVSHGAPRPVEIRAGETARLSFTD